MSHLSIRLIKARMAFEHYAWCSRKAGKLSKGGDYGGQNFNQKKI